MKTDNSKKMAIFEGSQKRKIKNMNKNKNSENNLAFVDGQNLYLGTNSENPAWKVDLTKFRQYLTKKYSVQKAYYFLGFVNEGNKNYFIKWFFFIYSFHYVKNDVGI